MRIISIAVTTTEVRRFRSVVNVTYNDGTNVQVFENENARVKSAESVAVGAARGLAKAEERAGWEAPAVKIERTIDQKKGE